MLKATMMLRMSLEGSIVPTVPTCIPFMITGLGGQSGNISIIAINDRTLIEEAVAFQEVKAQYQQRDTHYGQGANLCFI